MKKLMKIDVAFVKRIFGYDTEQVDSYIVKLTGAYQLAYDEYNALYAKYTDLSEQYENERVAKAPEPDYSIVTKTLAHAEVLVKKILDDAREEAAKIIEASEKIKSSAYLIKENAFIAKATSEIQVQKMIEDVNAEAAASRETSRRIMESANAEAEKARREARKIIEDANAEAARIIGAARGAGYASEPDLTDGTTDADDAVTAHGSPSDASADKPADRLKILRFFEPGDNKTAAI